MQTGTLEGVKNDIWAVPDAEIENQIIDMMRAKPIYIADGHHRYTTALQFQKDAIAANGGKPLPATDPRNYCMFVLVGMQDDGLLILPTHRILGNLDGFDMQIFSAAVGNNFEIQQRDLKPEQWDDVSQTDAMRRPHEFGLYDGVNKKFYTLKLRNPDLLKADFGNQSEAWRQLDVAILQHYLIDKVIKPEFAKDEEIDRAYTANPNEITKKVDGKNYQIALMLRPTPLQSLEELGKKGEVMPQKSTYFYPKLATGLVINPLS
jgi:uncharacterized protein (DUF1015 family)